MAVGALDMEEVRRRLDERAGHAPPPPIGTDKEDAAEVERARVRWRWERWVPRRFHGATLDSLDTQDKREAVAEWWQDPTRNLVLLGKQGRGKSFLAATAARLAIEAGMVVKFWPTVELFDALRPDAPSPRDTMAECTDVQVLVLDDLGAEKVSDWTLERLYAIVNRRWLERRPTIVTSNLDVTVQGGDLFGELVGQVGARMVSRLVQDAVRAKIGGQDRRL
ncbi:MAG: ATP-binding protein [Egibacteraceae bacterium]